MSTEASRPDAMQRFRKWAAWAVALSALGYLAYAVARGFGETAEELRAFPWLWMLPVLATTLVNYSLRYLKWHYLLGRVGVSIPHRQDAPIFAAGLAMVISPAKAGEVLKPWLVREVTGAPMIKTLPVLVAERATDGIAVVFLAAIGVTTYAADQAWLIGAAVAVMVVGLAAIASEPVVSTGLRLVGSVPAARGVAEKLTEAYGALRTVLAPGPLLLTVLISLVAWFAECVGTWLVLRGFGLDASLDLSTFVYAFSTVFGAPSPGGLGMADLALAESLIALLPGVGAGQAVAATLLVRLATLWFGVGIGAVALLRMEAVIADR